MNHTQNLLDMFEDSKHLLFYKVMKYPVPKDYEYFMTKEKKDLSPQNTNQEFSWHHKSDQFQEYANYIQKYTKLRKAIPFIKNIYLGNSMSFNGLKDGSDIDLCIITKK